MMRSSCFMLGRAAALVLAISSAAFGQFVGGTLIDRKSGKPIPLVRVVLLDPDAQKIQAEAKADTTGMFLIEAPRGGTYRLAFTRSSSVLGATDPFVVADTEFVQRRFLFDVVEDEIYFEFQVTKRVAPVPGHRPPRYPDKLRQNAVSGEVIAQFVVDTLGRAEVGTFRVQRATHPDFVTAVRDALPSFRFHPASIGGRPVRQMVFMPFQFSVTR